MNEFINIFWQTTCRMAPALIFGFFMSGILSVLIKPEFIRKYAGRDGVGPIIKASLFGVPLPLCSCAVIPVAMSFRKNGAHKGPVISFLISTPQTGIDSLIVTYSMLGPVFALFRPFVAFISGLFGGILTEKFDVEEVLNSEEKKNQKGTEGVTTDVKCEKCCDHEDKKQHTVTKILEYSFITMPRDLAGPLIIGLLISSIISYFVPNGWFAANIGPGITGMLLMIIVGIPLYVCSTASVPIAATLMLKGITPGAALVFLMTGTATNAATVVAVTKFLGKKTVFVYLSSVIGTALVSGYILNLIYKTFDQKSSNLACQVQRNSFWSVIPAVFLVLILIYPVMKKIFKRYKVLKV